MSKKMTTPAEVMEAYALCRTSLTTFSVEEPPKPLIRNSAQEKNESHSKASHVKCFVWPASSK